MDNSIKFNVIIPTRERADVLVHCLRTIVAQDYQNLKIIVSDNFSQDGTKDVVASFSDDRIEYINTGCRLSMAHNWEFALKHVMDGWVMFLGDDDGLLPWALCTLNKLIQKHNVEAVSSVFGSFRWPGHFSKSLPGRLLIPVSEYVAVKDSRSELERALSGDISYVTLPWLYHGGAASIDLINRARDKGDRFFCSQIPDLYSAVALCCVSEKYLSIGTPIAINGASVHSTGTAQMYSNSDQDHPAKIEFQSENNIPFYETLIIGKSLQIMLYECYLQSWHLHNGSLGISLKNQLFVAMDAAPFAQRLTIKDECQRIADKNGISFSCGDVRINRIQKLLYRAEREWWNIEVDAEKLNIMNVYDASVASAYLYGFVRGSSFRYALLATNFIGRVMRHFRKTIDMMFKAKRTV